MVDTNHRAATSRASQDASTRSGAGRDGDRPHGLQYIKYHYGAKLPDSMRDWVFNDLTGPYAALRMVAWWAVPCVIILVPMLFVPADWLIRANMTVPILIPYIFFSVALNRVYRRYRLSQHGFDPDLVSRREKEKNADVYAEYHRKYRGAGR
ncbi:DUF5313 domain-containing protein [Gordonia polyisoprenivorans]|uniref:DUF5313 domain-containing protein n=1 Tax=Gordonia polyisoprenivorans TaxID=84595 RepID=UPI001AD6DD73|nr:DUF5313 domain-containing protein [Gordonia polyisoprenivorans]QTI67215.1 DUF5313 domain-containing protein [Gordonia polyisoprenivorans]